MGGCQCGDVGRPGGPTGELENGSGVHRRAGPANDNQGVDAQHEQVPALFRAHLGQRLQKGIVQQGHATLALRWNSKQRLDGSIAVAYRGRTMAVGAGRHLNP